MHTYYPLEILVQHQEHLREIAARGPLFGPPGWLGRRIEGVLHFFRTPPAPTMSTPAVPVPASHPL